MLNSFIIQGIIVEHTEAQKIIKCFVYNLNNMEYWVDVAEILNKGPSMTFIFKKGILIKPRDTFKFRVEYYSEKHEEIKFSYMGEMIELDCCS